MKQIVFKYTAIAVLLLMIVHCDAQKNQSSIIQQQNELKEDVYTDSNGLDFNNANVVTGAEQLNLYLNLIKGKNVGLVTNQTGIIKIDRKNQHLVDVLISQEIQLKKIFAPEHGFRGKADAGEHVKDGIDTKTNLPIISLYGSNRKPTKEQFKDLDIVLFDIQDVGVRFYTYISTLHYVMETAAEVGIPVIVLDRPNPNGHYIDGPIREKAFQSFVGMHPVPIVYGMTIGEYAQMINGEEWMKNKVQADLTVIPLQNYDRLQTYDLPVKPSPNLPNAQSINLYPSLCFFEGTNVSEGRGTSKQFQIYGSPYLKGFDFAFTPEPNEGAKNPQHNGKLCFGEDLSQIDKVTSIDLQWLMKAYKSNTKQPFFTKQNGKYWIDMLAGTSSLRKSIEQGKSEEEIKKGWEKDLNKFSKVRSKYLLYP